MGIIRKIRDRIYNGKDWDTVHYETSADLVITNDGGNVEDKIGKMGKIIEFNDSASTIAINIGGDIWFVKTGLATNAAGSNKGISWSYTIPEFLKCKKILGTATAYTTSSGLDSITTGYCVDYTAYGESKVLKGATYDMIEGKATRVRIEFYMISDL